MTSDETRPIDRRAVLRRGAGVAAGVWAVPVVESFTRPAAAASPSAPAEQCLEQVFLVDAQGNPLTFTPGRERSFNVDLNASFAQITSITVRLYESPTDPVDAGEDGYVVFKKEDGTNAAIGVIFSGSQADPITIGFSPGGGHPPDQSYEDLLADGRAELRVGQDSGGTGRFSLLRVEIEVCGTVA